MSSKAAYLQKYLSGGQSLPGQDGAESTNKKKKKKKKAKDGSAPTVKKVNQ